MHTLNFWRRRIGWRNIWDDADVRIIDCATLEAYRAVPALRGEG